MTSETGTFFRRFTKNPTQFSIAIAGLVLAWICSISIGSFLLTEFQYDQFHSKSDRIFRVTHNEKAGEIPGTRHLATVGPPMGPGLKEEFSQVEEFVRFRHSADWIVRNGSHQHYEDNVWYTDSSFFTVFDFELLAGDRATALSLPNNVVITEDIAVKYFGGVDVVGKSLQMNNTEWQITAVLKTLPSNSHIKFDFLLPFQSFHVPFGYPVTLESWGWISFHTYILLKDGEDVKALEAALPTLVRKHWPEDRAKKFRLELQPLTDIYLGEVSNENIASGNPVNLFVLGISAVMVLFIAAFNFANIFMVIGLSRAKEIGVRKLLGARKTVLGWRLHREAIFIVFLSLAGALLIIPALQSLLPWQIDISGLSATHLAISAGVVVVAAISIALLAGIYPSGFMVRMELQHLLKGTFKTGRTGRQIRSLVLLMQFVVSIALVCCVMIILRQMKYIEGRDLGYEKKELLLLHVPGEDLSRNYSALQNNLLQHGEISGVSIGGGRMDGDTGNVPIYTESTEETGQPMAIDAVSFDFFRTIGINPVAGREFTRLSQADTLRGVIINESAAKEFGWPPALAIGKKIRVGDIVLDGEVIGVVPDFNFGSLRDRIAPLVLSYPRTRLRDVYVRFTSTSREQVVSVVTKTWSEIFPQLPIDYSFMDDHLSTMYRTEQRFSQMFSWFAIVAIVIACLGLYGTISQDILYRTKEIGIRKVLGESGLGVARLLLREFIVLVAVANIIAWPIAYLLMDQWLAGFVYRINLPWFTFPLAGAVVLLLSILSVSSLSVRAAAINPVQSLRND